MSRINKTFSNGQPLDAKDLNDLAAGVNNAVPIDAESGVTKDGDNYYIKDADGNVLTVPHTSVGAMIADYIKNNPDQQAKVTFGASSLQALQTTIGTNLYGATTAAGLASVVAEQISSNTKPNYKLTNIKDNIINIISEAKIGLNTGSSSILNHTNGGAVMFNVSKYGTIQNTYLASGFMTVWTDGVYFFTAFLDYSTKAISDFKMSSAISMS